MMLKVLLPPIIVPILAYGIIYSDLLWGTAPKSNLEDLDKKEMERWSADAKLKINDPKYNPFVKNYSEDRA